MAAAKNRNRNQTDEPASHEEAKRKRAKPQKPPKAAGEMSSWLKWLLSVFVIWHLFVVFICPFSIDPTSPTAKSLASNFLVRWYANPLYLNHGYSFFAPNPPVNKIVRYQVLGDDGATIAEGEFPNKEQQWPRLFYHRHMMLADQAGIGAPPVSNGKLVTQEEFEQGTAPQSFDDPVQLSLRSYARHLLRRYEGAETRIDYVEHGLLDPSEVQDQLDEEGNVIAPKRDENGEEMFALLLSVREFASDLDRPLIKLPQKLPTPNQADADTLGRGGDFE